MGIGEINLDSVKKGGPGFSYRFSTVVPVWGWATWRRAWRLNYYPIAHYSTNTRNVKNPDYGLRLKSLDFPLVHTDFMMVDHAKDNALFVKAYPSPSSRIKSYLKSLLPDLIWKRFVVPLKGMVARFY